MEESALALLSFFIGFVILAVAALRFGVDSRWLTRESPLPGEPAVRLQLVASRGERALPVREVSRLQARPVRMTFASRSSVPGVATRSRTPVLRDGLA
jgi:hypothetical protein